MIMLVANEIITEEKSTKRKGFTREISKKILSILWITLRMANGMNFFPVLPLCVISVSSLHDPTSLFGHKADLVIARPDISFVRGVAQAVLIAQFRGNLI